ncbi:Manganese transporter SMF1 [Erysiphe neolycopersici]|uniref:Manganese transporter SMF1 n=1 Tax=Erysiphe neolycopersici TaxID=212602 RepID=A0A420HH11_9PEZI|nr:Manganese transporter SMF1 [Erysiphe neolycopersici]
MNCPSRTDNYKGPTYNQNSTASTANITDREDSSNRANLRAILCNTNQGSTYEKNTAHFTKNGVNENTIDGDSDFSDDDDKDFEKRDYEKEIEGENEEKAQDRRDEEKRRYQLQRSRNIIDDEKGYKIGEDDDDEKRDYLKSKLEYLSDIKLSKEDVWNILATIKEYLKFVGPGFMISVAYIDPGNYSVNVTAGATFRFRLLYMGLISNLFSIFYHGLCVKLGSITGLNLAEASRAFLPRWLNMILYVIAELSASNPIPTIKRLEVVGTGVAVSLLLPKVPLQLACAISILDVIFIRVVSGPDGKLKGLRAFEFFVMALVMGVVTCFCIQLCMIKSPNVGDVLSGYIPSGELMNPQGIFQACGILGSTLMPHSLYLGSGLIQPRLKQFDLDNGLISPEPDLSRKDRRVYKPSLEAINTCMRVFITEVIICLFIFALFVNSAILIIAGSSLYDTPGSNADLFGIHDVLSTTVGPAAGTIFAFALLLSGGSAAIVCTLAGQMISSGAVHGNVSPWLRRLLTRVLTTLPSIVIATISGRQGLDNILDAAQVLLSLLLPFIIAPLIYFTSLDRYMTVRTPVNCIKSRSDARSGQVGWDAEALPPIETKMGNHWFTTTIAISIWLFIVALNGANIFGKVFSSTGVIHGGSLMN